MTARFPIWQLLVALAAAAKSGAEPPLLPRATRRSLRRSPARARQAHGREVPLAAAPHARLARLPRRGRARRRRAASATGSPDVEIVELPGGRQDLLRHAALASGRGTRVRRALGAARSATAGSRSTRSASWDAMPLVARAGQRERATSPPSSSTSAPAPTRADYAGKRRSRQARAGLRRSPRRCVPLAVDASAPPASSATRRTSARPGGARTRTWCAGATSTASAARRPSRSWSRSRPARALPARGSRAGETIRLHAVVRAGQHAGALRRRHRRPSPAPTRRAERGDRLQLPPRPSASGRQRQRQRLRHHPRSRAHARRSSSPKGGCRAPARTLRFVWPPEIEGTLALLNVRPELAARIKAAIHLDMVGGGPETKAIFHVTRGPASLPSFVHDVAAAFGEFVNGEIDARSRAGGRADFPLVAPEGRKEPLRAEFAASRWAATTRSTATARSAIPAIYLNDWPDRYIHTNFDTPANIDPTKLEPRRLPRRRDRLGARQCSSRGMPAASRPDRERGLSAGRRYLASGGPLADDEAATHRASRLRASARSLPLSRASAPPSPRARKGRALPRGARVDLSTPLRSGAEPRGDGALVYRRNPAIKGPMSVFGYDYLAAHLAAGRGSSASAGRRPRTNA